MDEARRQAALSIINPTLARSREELQAARDGFAKADAANPLLPALLDMTASIAGIEEALVQLVTVLLDPDKLQ